MVGILRIRSVIIVRKENDKIIDDNLKFRYPEKERREDLLYHFMNSMKYTLQSTLKRALD